MRFRRSPSLSALAIVVFACAAFTERVEAQGRGRSTAPAEQPSLESLAGDYKAQAQIVQVRLRSDGVLTIAVPPQPVRELESIGSLRFAQKGLAGYSVEFVRDQSGNVVALISHQPNGDFGAARVRAASSAPATGQGASAAAPAPSPATPARSDPVASVAIPPSSSAADPAPDPRTTRDREATRDPSEGSSVSAPNQARTQVRKAEGQAQPVSDRTAAVGGARPAATTEPTLASFSAVGLNYERDLTGLFLGDFEHLRLSRESLEFDTLLSSYLKTFARHCSADLPASRVEMTKSVCVREQYPVNRYGVQVGASTCVEYQDVGTGLYADPDLYAAWRRVDADTGRTVVKDVLGSLSNNNNVIGTAMHARDAAASVGHDMESLIATNGCASPSVHRFQDNLLRFAQGRAGVRLASGETLASIGPAKAAPGAPFRESDYAKLLEDLVSEQSRTWMMNRYIRGSVSDVRVTSRDQTGHPLEVVGQYAFDGVNGRSTGTVTLRFSDRLPQCMYFPDFPNTCRTASPRIVAAYENNKYQQ